MRDRIILARGKGKDDWNCSAPHCVGRILSRTEARAQVSLDDFKKSMVGIYTATCNEFTVDESVFAYKPKEEILDLIGETVDIFAVPKACIQFQVF